MYFGVEPSDGGGGGVICDGTIASPRFEAGDAEQHIDWDGNGGSGSRCTSLLPPSTASLFGPRMPSSMGSLLYSAPASASAATGEVQDEGEGARPAPAARFPAQPRSAEAEEVALELAEGKEISARQAQDMMWEKGSRVSPRKL